MSSVQARVTSGKSTIPEHEPKCENKNKKCLLLITAKCHLPLQEVDYFLNTQEFFRYKIAKGQGFSVTNFLQLQSEKSSDKIRVWFGKFENFDFIPESRGRLSP